MRRRAAVLVLVLAAGCGGGTAAAPKAEAGPPQAGDAMVVAPLNPGDSDAVWVSPDGSAFGSIPITTRVELVDGFDQAKEGDVRVKVLEGRMAGEIVRMGRILLARPRAGPR